MDELAAKWMIAKAHQLDKDFKDLCLIEIEYEVKKKPDTLDEHDEKIAEISANTSKTSPKGWGILTPLIGTVTLGPDVDHYLFIGAAKIATKRF